MMLQQWAILFNMGITPPPPHNKVSGYPVWEEEVVLLYPKGASQGI